MEKKVWLIAILLLLTGLVNAEITLTEPETVYNLGDRIYLNAQGLIGANSGNFNIDLLCGNKTINMVRYPARSFSMDKESEWSLPYKIINRDDLEITNITDVIGTCQIVASLGSAATSTKTFTITNEV